jgi:hypothetical protein
MQILYELFNIGLSKLEMEEHMVLGCLAWREIVSGNSGMIPISTNNIAIGMVRGYRKYAFNPPKIRFRNYRQCHRLSLSVRVALRFRPSMRVQPCSIESLESMSGDRSKLKSLN